MKSEWEKNTRRKTPNSKEIRKFGGSTHTAPRDTQSYKAVRMDIKPNDGAYENENGTHMHRKIERVSERWEVRRECSIYIDISR